ncbi:MAG: GAF domain-containing protein [Acidobacteria bacterium]|nr:GAF domain-containing protein [Acidobacteriota bacterium]
MDLNAKLADIVASCRADSGTIHMMHGDGVLHLEAATANIPAFVLDKVQLVPVGKGMAGLAVERNEPVTACNIQTDTTGDVRSGAKATGLQGAIALPIRNPQGQAVGCLGVANFAERTFTEEEIAQLLAAGGELVTGR